MPSEVTKSTHPKKGVAIKMLRLNNFMLRTVKIAGSTPLLVDGRAPSLERYTASPFFKG